MINKEALYKITYGLYAVCSGDKDRGNGFISNTVFQVSSKPAKFAVGCNKRNYTSEIIDKYRVFSISVLNQETDPEFFGRLGYRSGKDFNKLEGLSVEYGETGAPIILNNCVATLECKVVEKLDVGSHWLFIGELINAKILDESGEPISYSYYRLIKNGVAPKNAPTYIEESESENSKESAGSGKYRCAVCGYIYDEEREGVKFSDLPEDWKCPACGTGKENFIKI